MQVITLHEDTSEDRPALYCDTHMHIQHILHIYI